MKKQVIISSIAILLATTAMTSAATACEQGKHGSYTKHHHASGHHNIPGKSLSYLRLVVKNASSLKLNDKQRKAVGALLIQAESDASAAHAKAEITVAEFRSKLYAGKVTARDVKAYSNRMGELRAMALSARLLPSIQVKGLLTKEQQKALKALHRQDRKSCAIKEKHRKSDAGQRT
ncbi:MAG: Spy/CpxP family protein refolding chaperone [Mariprofundus sp.]|nr:Spy/CpxP family protein refolding chaperone [Mariprofundus sp.]